MTVYDAKAILEDVATVTERIATVAADEEQAGAFFRLLSLAERVANSPTLLVSVERYEDGRAIAGEIALWPEELAAIDAANLSGARVVIVNLEQKP